MKRKAYYPSKTEGMISFLTLLILVAGIVLYYSNDYFFNLLVTEDGIAETLTVLFFFVGAIVTITRIFSLWGTKNIRWKAFTFLLLFALIFAGGEEISWGQRIFDIETGEYFRENNIQGETNLHNLEVKGIKLNKVIFSVALNIVLGIYFFILIFFYLKNSRIKNLINSWGFILPRPYHSILLAVCAGIILLIPSSKKWELLEFAFSVVFFMVLVWPYNHEEIYRKEKL